MLAKRLLILFLTLFSVNALTATEYKSHYIGQESREIKSLSEDAISQLKSGKGWGLAKAAELNGLPGPAHILQMKKEINLTKDQERKIQQLFNSMKSKAIPLGHELIELERALNNAFSDRSITRESLRDQLDKIAQVRMQLRYVHLETHLLTPGILSETQVKKYNLLRGYAKGDPCNNIPAGHDAAMWKKHNDCR